MATAKNYLATYWGEIKYGFHVIVRPFDGFYDLKHEKRGSLRASFTIALALILVFLLEYQFSGFFFVTNIQRTNASLVREATIVLAPFFLWIVANWGFTTLMDGEGSMKDVAIATGYALLPIILVTVPIIIVSNFVSLEERALIESIRVLGIIWAGFLVFVSVIVTHQYTLPKTIITIGLSIVGMAVLFFIGLLIVTLTQQVLSFFVTVYNEANLRWR